MDEKREKAKELWNLSFVEGQQCTGWFSSFFIPCVEARDRKNKFLAENPPLATSECAELYKNGKIQGANAYEAFNGSTSPGLDDKLLVNLYIYECTNSFLNK